ncbi:MAG TPA: efflux RND transporter periplasmic adaptor subunit [Flavitalea sp.]|nr:efflux RND transporter periplasmic adaptor subunit [Flavitalea sp.]
MIRSYSLLFFLIGGSLVVSSCGNKPAPVQGPPPAVSVTLTTVKLTNATYYDEYPATVSALNEINLTAQVTGYVTGIHFKDGNRVKKGQLLYSLDQQVYAANYQQAVADLQVQEANLEKSRKDAERYQELDKHDAIAKQQVDYANAAYEVAKRQVAAARANVSSVQSNVKFSKIYAPFTGTIGISKVKQGTSVVAGQTILNTVSTDNPIAVDFNVDQKELYRFVQLQQNNNKPADSVFTIAFGNDVYPYAGRVELIDRAVDPQTGTIKTRLVFPNEKGMLKPGMNATVRVRNNASSSSTLIPYKAVTEQLGEFFVYVVGDSSKVTQRRVQLSKQVGSGIIVREGLKEGEQIAVEGIQNLREGTVITTAASTPPGTPAKK